VLWAKKPTNWDYKLTLRVIHRLPGPMAYLKILIQNINDTTQRKIIVRTIHPGPNPGQPCQRVPYVWM
jgi:hypothetical protein